MTFTLTEALFSFFGTSSWRMPFSYVAVTSVDTFLGFMTICLYQFPVGTFTSYTLYGYLSRW